MANQRLSTYEKEFLAGLMVVDKWRPYLFKQPFTIRTDHRSLCHLQDQNLYIDIQRKAMTKLARLQFRLLYKKEQKTLLLTLCLEWGITSWWHQYQLFYLCGYKRYWIFTQWTLRHSSYFRNWLWLVLLNRDTLFMKGWSGLKEEYGLGQILLLRPKLLRLFIHLSLEDFLGYKLPTRRYVNCSVGKASRVQ